MKTKATDAEKQVAAIAEAVEKTKAEMSVNPDVEAAETLVKRHGEELKALEEKLKAEYEGSLKTAGPSDADTQAAIDAAVAEFDKKAKARLQEEISSAVERGRMEQAAKNKLKDSQLFKAQKRVKELEQQIHEWQASGIDLPSPSTSGPPPTIPASSPTVVPTQPVAKLAATTGQPAANQPQLSTSQPPSKPSGISQPKQPATTVTTSNTSQPPLARKPPLGPSGASLTRGVPQGPGRGGAMLRGRGGGATRGGAPLRQPPVKPAAAAAATSGGVSIMGAASKRPREETSSSSEDSLAKRLKPADAAT